MMKSESRSSFPGKKDLAVTAESGKEVRFGSGRPLDEQERTMRKLNEYLAAQGV